MALAFVEHQTPEICLAAVQDNGFALMDVIHQTEELCLEAVKQNPIAIEFIRDKDMFYKVAKALDIEVE